MVVQGEMDSLFIIPGLGDNSNFFFRSGGEAMIIAVDGVCLGGEFFYLGPEPAFSL